ncbi:LolA family protein [Algisphaera agarilytica]|uniref:Outer membrane lipoprotein-sorting protein n=1 Tax=Algisphaera agarilytica TaxID=1385975 RepID=A0A7X0LJ87_9BACT|nr:hypothetical protein [Algisphaera agarilytica]MBB6428341.1 outer membrane lipoprotein-sorting protein [Algisphaera agarilytica]
MTQEHPQPEHDALIQDVVTAFDGVEVPPMPEVAQTVAALEAASSSSPSAPRPLPFYRRPAMKFIAPLSAAAVAGLAVMLSIVFLGAAPSPAYAQVREQLNAIQTATFTMTMNSDQGEIAVDCWVKSPGHMRQKLTMFGQDIISVIDFSEQRIMSLVEADRLASFADMSGLPEGQIPDDIVEEFRNISDGNSVLIGEEEIDGVLLLRYDFSQGEYEGSMWVDPSTNLPVRSEMVHREATADSKTGLVIDQFVWNPALDASLFELKVPEGYRTHEISVQQDGVEDLKIVLQLFAYANNGVYPDQFDALSYFAVGKVMHPDGLDDEGMGRYWAGLIEEVTGKTGLDQQQMQAEGQKIGEIVGRTGLYLSFLQDLDYHWLGRGVKQGDGEAMLCAWNPTETPGYTVVFGDLSVKIGVDAKDLPFNSSE